MNQHTHCHGPHDTVKEHMSTRSAEASKYACPMHPEVTSDAPGICPKCHMALEKTKKTPERLSQLDNRL